MNVIAPAIAEEVRRRLADVEATDGVRVLLKLNTFFRTVLSETFGRAG